jgi:hypothetical protein
MKAAGVRTTKVPTAAKKVPDGLNRFSLKNQLAKQSRLIF